MVIKGKARGAPDALAAHLQRRDTNEDIRLREFEGVTARDVLGALREMDAMGSGAISRRTLYHAAINSAPNERLNEEQKRLAVQRLADELGFKGQPHIVVEHFKKDREHLHIVFLRIEVGRMTAIPDSHNYRKHEIVARTLEREFGHTRVPGAHVEREGPRPGRTPSHSEMQQAERTGTSPQMAKEQVTQLWRQADSGRAFTASVTAEGWVLARGDKRDFVLVDRAGESHSLARRVEGAKAADIRQRMHDVDPATLPTVAEAKDIQRANPEIARGKEKEKSKTPHVPSPTLLKVEAPQRKLPTSPLEISPMAGRPVDPKTVPRRQNESIAAPESTAEKPRQWNRLQRLYTVAAATTQRVVETARQTLKRKPAKAKPKPTQERVPNTPHTTKRAAPLLSPVQREMKRKLDAAREIDRKPRSVEKLDRPIGRRSARRNEPSGPNR